jgi:serine/threonine protein kinase/Tfp pilus assembly protein PilF
VLPSVAPRYRILREVGRGGMGVVYEAEDLKLHRIVALKFLPEDLTASEDDIARFQQEAEAISALNHTHIATIYDIDEAEGRKFLTLEFLSGGTLKSKVKQFLADGNEIPIGDVLEYGIQIAEGLAHAHRQGIIHRDIKTDNVMLTSEGSVKLTDFGLAKLKGKAQITRAGSTLGTAAYVSPEQLRSEDTDRRSDLFSLGVVLYELLTGHLPFRGEHESALTYSIAHEDPTPVDQFRKNVPLPLVKVIHRCLEKDKTKRYQDADAIASDLREARKGMASQGQTAAGRSRLPWIAAGATIAVAAALYFFLPSSRPGAVNGKSIAVLPFTNMSGNAEDEYFSDGVTEDILTQLSKISDLNVISRTSVMQYKGTKKTIREIGKELNVGVILEGSIRRAGDQVRIVAQLIDATNDRHIWAETYDKEFKQIFAVQSEVAQKIAGALQAKLSSSEKERIEIRPTSNTEAYTDYLKGRHHWNKRRADDLRMALDYFNKAVEKDPSYATAYVALAETYALLPEYAGAADSEMFARAEEAATKALALDPSMGEAHAVFGLLYVNRWDYAGGEAEFRKALELSPGIPSTHQWYSLCLTFQGKLQEGLAEMSRAHDLDPLSLVINADIAFDLIFLKDYDRAIDQFKKTLELDQNFGPAVAGIGEAYVLKGLYAEAVEASKRASALMGNDPFGLSFIGYTYARCGKRDSASAILDKLLKMITIRPHIACFVAVVYNGLGEKEKAFEWLEKGCQGHDIYMRGLRVDPSWDEYRSDPRFVSILKRVGLGG